jgi:hypothetical protein
MISSLLKSFIISLILFNSLFPQNYSEPSLARTRILAGYSSLIQEHNKPELNSFFLNFNYRTSDFNPVDRSVELGGVLELGVNFASAVREHYEGIVFIPYVKGGPELRLTRNLYTGASVGFASLFGGYFAIAFYGGVNSQYLIPLNKSQYLEIEGGFNSVLFIPVTAYMVYLSTGFAFR